jgi:hypothetical protein
MSLSLPGVPPGIDDGPHALLVQPLSFGLTLIVVYGSLPPQYESYQIESTAKPSGVDITIGCR